jgi:hypothetical protein
VQSSSWSTDPRNLSRDRTGLSTRLSDAAAKRSAPNTRAGRSWRPQRGIQAGVRGQGFEALTEELIVPKVRSQPVVRRALISPTTKPTTAPPRSYRQDGGQVAALRVVERSAEEPTADGFGFLMLRLSRTQTQGWAEHEPNDDEDSRGRLQNKLSVR